MPSASNFVFVYYACKKVNKVKSLCVLAQLRLCPETSVLE